MTYRNILGGTILLAGAGIFCGLGTGCKPVAAPFAFPPPQVTVASIQQKPLVEWEDFTGRAEPVEAVDIRARVSGYIEAVKFRSGQMVKKGDVLFIIDPRTYQATLDGAKAQVERARVELDNAQRESDRAKRLLASKAMSTEESDQRVARFQEAKAASLSAQAMLDSASLDLDFTSVRAPVAGRVSRAYLTEGNYVSGMSGNASLLTTVVSVDPIYVYADVDEDSLLRFNNLMGRSQIETNEQGRVPVDLELADETNFTHQGYIESFDNRVDANTGSILLRAVFPNKDGRILPGLFARIRLPLSARYPALLVPEAAIGTDQAQKYVLTVTSSNTVAYRGVVLGPMVDGKRIVRSGLEPGDQIIVNGLEKIHPGMKVVPGTETNAPGESMANR